MNKHTPNNSKFHQGKYNIKNPKKYMGNADDVFFRSSWELKAFEFFDNNPNVIKWGSEEIPISYLMPLPNGNIKKRTYYPDIYVEYLDVNGVLQKELIEIKPIKQLKISKAKKATTRYYENHVYLVNQLKFDAAVKWCLANGVKFKTASENQIFKI